MKNKRNDKRNLPIYLKISAASLLLLSTVVVALPSIAEESTTVTYQSAADSRLGREDSVALSSSLDTQVQNINQKASECGDLDNPNGLGAAQKNAYDDRITMMGAITDTDKIFDVGNKGGCFDALKNFPNLSVSIPSLSSIGSALQKTLIDYATRKVCNAVNDAVSEVINPINEVLDKVSENGQIDMTGTFNKTINKKLYEIDPELGRVSTRADGEYKWEVKTGDIVNPSNPNGTVNYDNSNNGGTSSNSSALTNTTASASSDQVDQESGESSFIGRFFN